MAQRLTSRDPQLFLKKIKMDINHSVKAFVSHNIVDNLLY